MHAPPAAVCTERHVKVLKHDGMMPTAHRRCADVDEHLAPAERHRQQLRDHGQHLARLTSGLAAHLPVAGGHQAPILDRQPKLHGGPWGFVWDWTRGHAEKGDACSQGL